MDFYYIVSVVIFLLSLLDFTQINRKTKDNAMWLIFIILVLVGGLRWSIGFDWEQYKSHFYASEFSNIFNYDRYSYGAGVGSGYERLEPGFVFLNASIKYVFKDFHWYNLIICSFIQFSYVRFCKRNFKDHALLAYAIFAIAISFMWFPKRTELSIAILMWAFDFMRHRELKPFLITIAIASSIHMQCLLVVPLYWVGYYTFPWYAYLLAYWIIWFFGVIVQEYIPMFIDMLPIDSSVLVVAEAADKLSDYAEYGDGNVTIEGNLFAVALYRFIYLTIFILFIKKSILDKRLIKEDNDENLWMRTVLNIVMIYYTITYSTQIGMRLLARIADPMCNYVTIVYIYSLIILLKSHNKDYRKLAILWYFLFTLKDFRHIADNPYFLNANVPYKTIFDYGISLFGF